MPNSAGEVHLGDQYTSYSVYQDYVRDLEEQNALGNDNQRILCRTQFVKKVGENRSHYAIICRFY